MHAQHMPHLQYMVTQPSVVSYSVDSCCKHLSDDWYSALVGTCASIVQQISLRLYIHPQDELFLGLVVSIPKVTYKQCHSTPPPPRDALFCAHSLPWWTLADASLTSNNVAGLPGRCRSPRVRLFLHSIYDRTMFQADDFPPFALSLQYLDST
jgi:hypothetical protein